MGVVLVMTTGCTTPDSLMKLTLKKGTADEQEAALELAEFVDDSSSDDSLRCWALRGLSHMRRVPPRAVNVVARTLRNTSEPPYIRSWAAFTLGEWGKKEGIPALVDAMAGNVDARTAYHVLEALSRVLPLILEDMQVNERMIEAMTVLAARQSQDLPTMYALLREYAVSLVALTVTSERIIRKGPLTSSAQRSEEVYTAVFRMMSNIEVAKTRLMAAYATNEKALASAFQLAYSSVDKRYRPTWLLLAWYAGVLGDNRELSALCERYLVAWAESADPALRLLTLWSLTRLELYSTQARHALVSRLLEREKNEDVLRLLAVLSTQEGGADALQKTLQVRVK